MRIAILGAPGSGKGTQAKILADKYKVPHISTGDLLREAKQNNTLDKNIAKAMDSGQLVPDEVVLGLLEVRLRKKDTKKGFILDGYPRSIPQAQSLDNLLGILAKPLQVVIYTEVDNDILVKRIIGRMTCGSCGAIYNKYFSPTKEEGVCDKCGSKKLTSRADDTEETVAVRVGVFKENTTPLISYYKAQHKLRTVVAMGEIEEINRKIADIIDLEIRPLEIQLKNEGHEEHSDTVISGGKINRISHTNESKAAAKTDAKTDAKVTYSSSTSEQQQAASAATKKTETKIAKKTAKKVSKKKAAKSDTRKVVSNQPAAKKATKKKAAKKAVSKATETSTDKKVVKKAKAQAVTKKTSTKAKATKKVTKKVAKKKVTKKGVAKSAAKPSSKKVAKKVAKKVVKKVAKKRTPRRIGSK